MLGTSSYVLYIGVLAGVSLLVGRTVGGLVGRIVLVGTTGDARCGIPCPSLEFHSQRSTANMARPRVRTCVTLAVLCHHSCCHGHC